MNTDQSPDRLGFCFLPGFTVKQASSRNGGFDTKSTRGAGGGSLTRRPHSVCRFLISRPF